MKRTIVILFITFFALQLSAQLVQVSGFVYQRGDSTVSLPYASIINKRTHTGVQSSVDGFYTILMAPGDTTELSLMGYKNVRFSLPANYVGNSYHKNVYMKDDIITLNPHEVYSITWERFVTAFQSIPVEEEKVYVVLDNKLNDKSPVNANPHLALNGPISWLYNKLGKKAKEQNKLQELREGSNADMEYSHRITNQYVMDITKLPEDQINAFLDYCHSDNSFYAYATDYDIKVKFATCLPGFKEKFDIKDEVPVNDPTPSDSLKTTPH
jgi:hypothetical protein